jgi:sulfur-oxidizing protein SoxZ
MAGLKIRAKAKGGVVEAKILATHEMESGLRKDNKTGQLIPAHFIEEMTIENNGKVVVVAEMSGAVSKNPYVAVNFEGAKGDTIKVSWKDNTGATETAQEQVK